MANCKQCIHFHVCERWCLAPGSADNCKDFLDKAKVVEAVHGRWIDNVDENGRLCNVWRKCSSCGGLNWSKKPPYCPNCGADMRGEEDG